MLSSARLVTPSGGKLLAGPTSRRPAADAQVRALHNQLMEIVTDGDLAYRLGGTSATLGALCREIGEIEHAYVESFRTFRQDLDYRHPDPAIETSVAGLQAWYAELDRNLMAALETLSEADTRS